MCHYNVSNAAVYKVAFDAIIFEGYICTLSACLISIINRYGTKRIWVCVKLQYGFICYVSGMHPHTSSIHVGSRNEMLRFLVNGSNRDVNHVSFLVIK